MNTSTTPWRFFRAGGFDQVRLDTAQELLALAELDPKLWVALSCPVHGIEFDAGTLRLVDDDGDGHIRVPELLRALAWAQARLRDPDVLVQQLPGVPITAIRDDDETGLAMVTAARTLAQQLGKDADSLLSVEEASKAQAQLAALAHAAWEAAGRDALPLGDATAAADAAVQAIGAKIDDYFMRCRLAAFDAQAITVLNAGEDVYKALSIQALAAGDAQIATLPLSRVSPESRLDLLHGLNPAWAAQIEALRLLAIEPLLGSRTHLTPQDWSDLQSRLAPYRSWLAARPDPAQANTASRDLEKLARYVRDLQSLANNFVAFKDFYTRQGKATFQVGTLYLDGRSCDLCVAVTDPARHAALATLSRMFLVYCECVRGSEKMTIAAAMTAGDGDQLMVGRNGVFYDRQGRDWDATIVSLVQQPISLRQAFWSPYKQLARFVAAQVQKLTASKAKASEDQLTALATDGGQKAAAAPAGKPAQAPTPFDVGKFAGIFAAIGLAVGALGTALASVLTGLFALSWWQIPLALAGLMLVISGPAMALAAFKLRSRTLGPLLDANGWAINARARINIPFGTTLTQLAQLPAYSERSLSDPYAEPPSRWPLTIGLLGVLTAVLIWIFLFR